MNWKPENHPCHKIDKKTKLVIDELFARIPSLEPTEMFRVQLERVEPMTYMKYNLLNDYIWKLVEYFLEREKPTSQKGKK